MERPKKKKKKKTTKSKGGAGLKPRRARNDIGTPGQRIQNVARGFRLSFKDLGNQRKLTDDQTAKMSSTIDTDQDQLKLAKVLYGKHPAIKAKNQAKSRLKELFDALTLPYPEAAVRLLPVREEKRAGQAKEVEAFLAQMQAKIRDYDDSVRELKRQWVDVVEKSRGKLRDLFQESDYPSADNLDDLLSVSLEPFNIDLPEYYKEISPAEYKRAAAMLNEKFEKAAQMQEQHILTAFRDSVDQMVSSIGGFHDGRQKSFKTSVVTRVFDAMAEFRTKCSKFGILHGTDVEEEFNRLNQIMTDGMHTTDTLPGALRSSEVKRADMLEKLSSVSEALSVMATNKPRRNLIR